jgi:hypothetical protein
MLGRNDQARADYDEALALYKQADDRFDQAIALYGAKIRMPGYTRWSVCRSSTTQRCAKRTSFTKVRFC